MSDGYVIPETGSGSGSFNPASPGPIGGTTPNTGTFTSVSSDTWGAQNPGQQKIRPSGVGSTTGQITIAANGDTAFTSTTGSTTATSGSAVFSGGIGVSGNVVASATIACGATQGVGPLGRSKLRSSADGEAAVWNNGNTALSNFSAAAITASGIVDSGKQIAGTTGAQTFNSSSGRVLFATAATSLVVTNSMATANSIITVSLATADASARLGAVVAAAGSFTIFMTTAPGATCGVNFQLSN